MTTYANEGYYISEYLCGRKAVIVSAFDYYARSATLLIKAYTGENVDGNNIPESVKLCCCELAELVYNDEKQSANSGISSASVGDESVSYVSEEERKTAHKKAVRYTQFTSILPTSDLLYRGGRR